MPYRSSESAASFVPSSTRRAAFIAVAVFASVHAGAQKLSSPGGPVSGPTVTAPSDRLPITESPLPQVAQSRKMGTVGPSETIAFTVALQPRDLAGLQAFADAVSDPKSPKYRQYITPDEVGDRFGAAPEDRQAVVSYLASKGITVTYVAPSGLAIMAQGTSTNVQNAFGTSLATYQGLNPDGRTITYRANATELTVPTTLSNVVTYVSGIETYTRPQKRGNTSTLTPGLISSAYGVKPSQSFGFYGAGRHIAISNWDGIQFSNARKYATYYGLPVPAAGVGTNISQTVITGFQDAEAQVAYGEGDLDVQMVIGQAPLADIRVYTGVRNANAAGEAEDRLATVTQEVNDNWADVITESYGWGGGATAYNSYHTVQLQMTVQGITYMAASGDSSTHISQFPYPDFDPEVLMVGGSITTVDDTTGARTGESGWTYSGGGWYNSPTAVTFNTLPSWQHGNGVPTNVNRRLIPDISFQAGANNNSNYNPGGVFVWYIDNDPTDSGQSYYNQQLLYTFDGTSCASPICAGLLGTIEGRLYASNTDSTRPRLGRIQDLIYAQNGRSDVYNDITSGTGFYRLPSTSTGTGNSYTGASYGATAGWDYLTGWGTVNMEGFYQTLLPTAAVSLTLGNYSGNVTTVPVVVQFRTPGTTTVVATQTVYPAADGSLSVKSPGVGTYDVSFKASHWLRRTLTNKTFTAAGSTGLSVSLINGDVNGDNVVNAADRSLVTAALGSAIGDPGYSVNADLNGDGVVTAADRSITTVNSGQVGDN